jgi:prephenate dehydrogenase
VIGLGLIGGSLARALTRAGYRVVGCDRAAVLREARRAGALSSAAATAERAAAGADVVFLAAPPRANLALLVRLAGVVRPGTVLSDVGSVKRPILRRADRLGLRSFVGGHPIAGSERSGFGASAPDLFRGRHWILTPGRATPAALAAVRSLVRAIGARPVRLGAAEHDRAVAFLSHAPQVAAWALLRAARSDAVAARRLGLAGPGFRDMTRLARSPRSLWRGILVQNADEVERALRRFRRALATSLKACRA